MTAPAPDASPRVPRGGRLRPALLWSYAVSTGMYAITAVITFILAAILGPAEFGLLWMAMVWVTLAQILLQHGPTMAVIQQDHITDDHLDAAFWSTVIGATLFALLLAAAAPLWAAFHRLPELTALCLILTAIVPLYAVNAIPEAVLRRRMRLRGIALRYLTSGLLSIGAALLGAGVWALVIQQVGMTLTNTVLLWLMISWRPRVRRFGSALRDIRGTSLKTLAGAVGTFVQMRADVLVMGTYFGPVVVGLFRFAMRVPELVMGLAARGLHDVALPDLARHGVDRRVLAERLARLVNVGALLSFPALGVVAAAAEPFVLLIGEQWGAAVTPMRLLCLAIAVTLFHSLFGPALQAAQRPGLPALMTWLNAACLVVAIHVAARLSREATIVEQVATVAAALILVYTAFAVALGYLVFARVLRASPLPALRAALPSAAAALAAAGSGAVVPAMLDGDHPPLVVLMASVVAAGTVAGVVVLTTDRQAKAWLRAVRSRVARPDPSGAS
jgi:O-antigen/teichoic acid export membrane protein